MAVYNRPASSQESSSEFLRSRSSIISAHSSHNTSSRSNRAYSACQNNRGFGLLKVSSKKRTRCKKLIRSHGWKALMVLFYTFVLFGYPLCRIFSVRAIVYDVLAILAFLFCVVEMGLHVFAEPQYLQYEPASVGARKNQIRGGTDTIKSCTLGSFLFWCDFISTGVILYHISWINKDHVRLKTFEISLDAYGFPVSAVFCNSLSLQLG